MLNIELLEDTFGEREIVVEILSMYITENKGVSTKVNELYINDNLEELHHLSHTLYGTLVNLMEEQIHESIKSIEHVCRSEQKPDQALVNTVLLGLTAIEEQIEGYLLQV